MPTQASLPTRLWTLQKDKRTATCDVDRHPIGLEVRYAVNGEMIRTAAFRDTPAFECDVNDARAAFEAVGWKAIQ